MYLCQVLFRIDQFTQGLKNAAVLNHKDTKSKPVIILYEWSLTSLSKPYSAN